MNISNRKNIIHLLFLFFTFLLITGVLLAIKKYYSKDDILIFGVVFGIGILSLILFVWLYFEDKLIIKPYIEEIIKDKEEALKQKNFINKIITTHSLGMIGIDKNNKVVIYNESAEKIFNYKEKEVLSIKTFSQLLNKKEFDFQNLVKHKLNNKTIEINFLNNKQDLIHLRINFSVIPSSDNIIIISIEDITNEINLKKNIEEQNRLTIIGELTKNISHHWRQPLNFVSTSISGILLLDSLNEHSKFSKRELETFHNIISKVDYLSNVIEDFKSLFIKQNKNQLFDIDKTIKKSINLMEKTLNNININIIYESHKLEVFAIENDLLQSIINIMNNSKDAFEKIENNKNLDRFINIRTSVINNDELKISILDNAGGIPNDIIDKIFDPYFTTKHQSEGVGIGLYMSKENIEKQMQGKLTVRNRFLNKDEKKTICAEFTIILKRKRF